MRIVQFASFYTPVSGGLRTAVDQLGQGYTERGHERTLVVPGFVDRDEMTGAGRRITLASPSMFGSDEYRRLNDRRTAYRLLDSLRPDVVEIHDKLQVTFLTTWAKKRGVPLVLVSHERLDAIVRDRVPALPQRVPLVAVVNRVNRALDKRVDHIVTASSFAEAEFRRAGVSAVRRIPLGVDLDTFAPGGGSAGAAGAAAAGGPLELVLLSRLSTEKNPGLAIQTLGLLRASGVDARMSVIGDGLLRERLELMARGLPVRFLGHVGDRSAIADVVGRADVALCPSGVETFGLATLEALACGTPVVVPPRGALREFVDGSPLAGRVCIEHPHGFARGVQDLLMVPADLRRAQARMVAERYPWSATVSSFLALHAALSGVAVAA